MGAPSVVILNKCFYGDFCHYLLYLLVYCFAKNNKHNTYIIRVLLFMGFVLSLILPGVALGASNAHFSSILKNFLFLINDRITAIKDGEINCKKLVVSIAFVLLLYMGYLATPVVNITQVKCFVYALLFYFSSSDIQCCRICLVSGKAFQTIIRKF